MKVTLILCSVIILAACTRVEDSPSKANPNIEIYDESALQVIDPAVTVKTLADGFEWTEGPVWVAKGNYLLFSDIPNNRVLKYSEKDGLSAYLEPSGGTSLIEGDYITGSNGLLINQENQLVLLQHGDRRVAVMESSLATPNAVFSSLASRYQGKRLNSPNDGVFNSHGALYFTDPPYGLDKANDDPRKELAHNGIYLLQPDGSLQLLDGDVSYPNGIGLTIDEETLIVAVSDYGNPHWLAYDVAADGTVSNKRMFYDASHLLGKEGEQGMPDGMVVHSNGMIFATGPGGVWLFDSDGKILAKIRTGQLTANCTLSSDEKTLYLTADDYLMSVSLK